MKRFVTSALLITLFIGAFSFTGVDAQHPSREWIVISAGDSIKSLSSLATSQIQIAGGRILRNMPQIGALVVSSSDANFARKMSAVGLIAAPNRIIPNVKPAHLIKEVSPASANGASNPLSIVQWNLQAVRAQKGWQANSRGKGVTVAVLDEGFYLNHPDLAANFDVAHAMSFVPGETVQWTRPNGFSHGTHVSGIIAAIDNSIGTIGVAPETKIIPVKVLSEQLGYGEDAWAINGLLYVAELRARHLSNVSIVNMSLSGNCEKTDPECVSTKKLYDLVILYLNLRGINVVISAGNERINADAEPNIIILPAQAKGSIAISATAPLGWAVYPSADPRRPASYSNFGRTLVDFAAPGGDSAYLGNENCTIGTLIHPCWVFDMIQSPGEASSDGVFYYWVAGTSMAAPHVSGILAQYASGLGGSITPLQAQVALRVLAQHLSPVAFYGSGFTRAN
jgi:lantibiotic leader peptide-processing serine protease